MSKNSNPRGGAAQPSRKGSSLLAGILVGMVLGLMLAGAVAWYILKGPSPFVNNVPHEAVKLQPDPVKPPPEARAAPQAGGTASGVEADKPRFEFYKVLTDKAEAPPVAKQAAKPADKAADKPARKDAYFLQAGAFASAEDADKLKAKLAMLGMEAAVQTATLPDKTVWYRVRLGPYKSTEEMGKASAQLKQNGVSATPMRNP